MHTSISASQWGFPTASRRALLIHGLSESSYSWEGLAQLLVADGFFVVAPNLLGHAWRRGTDYRLPTLAEDLRPYTDMSYDVIIGHSLGGSVALALMPFLPKTKETTIILLDPALEITAEQAEMISDMFSKAVADVRTADEFMAENNAWSRRDCVLRVLGLAMCDSADVKATLQSNAPCSYSGLLKNIPPNVTITVLVADPEHGSFYRLEHIPRDVERLNARVVTGVGHWIQYERPEAIMDVIPLPRANL